MAKKMMKGLTMLVLVVTLSFVTAVVSAKGQSSNQLRANIPFDFMVADTNLTAGQYQVSPVSISNDTIRVSSTRGSQHALRLSIVIGGTEPAKESKLVFHRYGDRYFLAEIWKAGEANGQKLQTSKAEKALSRELASINKAHRTAPMTYDRVEIAANCPN